MKKISFSLIFLILINVFYVYAQSESDYKIKLNDTKNTIKNMNETLSKNKNAQKKVLSRIKQIDTQIVYRENQINNMESDFNTIQGKIDKLNKDIQLIQNQIEQNQKVLGKRLKAIYKTTELGYLEVLISSKDVGEFIINLNRIKTIIGYDKNLLNKLSDSKESIENNKKELILEKKRMDSLKKSIEVEKQRLIDLNKDKNKLNNKLQVDEEKLESDIDDLNKYAKSLINKIKKLQINGDYTGGIMSWPVPKHSRISSSFGSRFHPILKKNKMHTGIDIPAPTGTNILAANDGKVINSGWLGGYGKAIIIDHGGGIVTLYGHNSKLIVSKGQNVKRGEPIAKAGSTGKSTGSHLHFEVRKNGNYIDPIPWVKSK